MPCQDALLILSGGMDSTTLLYECSSDIALAVSFDYGFNHNAKEITKTGILRRGAALGINDSRTWSCYKGLEKHCGRCGTCTERKEAFAPAGIPASAEYEE